MCIKSVLKNINSIRHNDIIRKAIPHVYNTITEKILPQFISTSQHLFTSNLLQLPKILKYLLLLLSASLYVSKRGAY